MNLVSEMQEQNTNGECSIIERLKRTEREIPLCWAGAGDESLPGEIRYQYAWGAMDWELNRTLLLVELEQL